MTTLMRFFLSGSCVSLSLCRDEGQVWFSIGSEGFGLFAKPIQDYVVWNRQKKLLDNKILSKPDRNTC